MRTLFHRFYDLFSGGGEVTILNMVTALPDWHHILAFNRVGRTWLSDALQKLPNVELVQTKTENVPALIERRSPDAVVMHWYPPMGPRDVIDLPQSVLERTILYNQWFRPLLHFGGLKRVVFVTPWLEENFGQNYPEDMRSVIINPVRDVFFDVEVDQSAPPTVGRHARPIRTKISPDFFELYEAIRVPDLQVRVLGYPPELLERYASVRGRLEKTYWFLPFNSMDVTTFLRFVQVYVYRTHPGFTEACGISVGEAMAAGIPPVVDARGGLTSLVSHGKTGFLAPTLDAFQAPVERLLEDRTFRIDIGRAARQWARENLSTSVFRRNLLAVLS
ncbi:MAG: glycosyltransferase family 4 protein [Myxococcota bacterium]|nr:glycosyltransferase family 4 protein [Myxococcota bacterium]MEC8423633.1 glycosyltransferase family 4 protein [Myxococcota bacterium]